MAVDYVALTIIRRRISMCSGQRRPWSWALPLGILCFLNLVSVGYSATLRSSVGPSFSPSVKRSVSRPVSTTVEPIMVTTADTTETVSGSTTTGYDVGTADDINYFEVPMEAVPVAMVEQRIQEAVTYHDVLSIFYGDRLTNDIIDNVLATEWRGRMSSKVRPRPRIGGLSDTLSFSPHETTFQALTKAMAHAKEMTTETECRIPKPRLVCMRDVNSVANKEYFPRCTVVHQCSPSVGCCNASAECSPLNTTTITRHFFVMVYKTFDHKVKPDPVETFTFVNHTACECRQINQIPRCRKCPFPFEIRRNDLAECTCECFSDDINCLRIKRGNKALSERELACLKANLCEKPKCTHGDFDETSIKTGYCPVATIRSMGATKRGSHHRVSTGAPQPARKRRG